MVWRCGSAGDEVVGAVHTATHAALHVLQRWLGGRPAGTLVVLTHGAVGLPGEDVSDLAAAAVWGLVRSAQAENPGRIVLSRRGRGGRCGGARRHRGTPTAGARRCACTPPGWPRRRRCWRYRPTSPHGGCRPVAAGHWRIWRSGPARQAHAPLQAGQVRVAVAAAGVNFRDVVAALGMYPGQAPVLGAEGAGVVIETGPEVARCRRR